MIFEDVVAVAVSERGMRAHLEALSKVEIFYKLIIKNSLSSLPYPTPLHAFKKGNLTQGSPNIENRKLASKNIVV